jgi:uncharacterized protein
MPTAVVSHVQVAPLLVARHRGEVRAPFSDDLGRSTTEAVLTDDGVRWPGGTLSWAAAEEIASAENACFEVTDDGIEPIRTFSEATGRVVGLMPTTGAPTMLLAGFYMHRVKGTEPWADTEAKIAAAAPVRGRVLDTTTGLGYTAIAAARTATSVLTIELDPAVVEICARNPWSRELFADPRIERRLGDAAEIVPELPAASFDRVIHDPPTLALAGQLYAGTFYEALFGVLRPGGRLFHYVGRPDSGYGARTGAGIVRRLRAAGFTRVEERPAAFGYVATRPGPAGRR